MLNINGILRYVLNGVSNKDPRFIVKNDEHILDTKTGVEFHLYDEDGKVTRDGELITKMQYFTPDEQRTLFELKNAITDPEEAKKKKLHYPELISNSRANFSLLFEKPQPLVNKEPVEEADTEEYVG